MTRLIVCDDAPDMRALLRDALHDDEDLEVLGEAADGDAVLAPRRARSSPTSSCSTSACPARARPRWSPGCAASRRPRRSSCCPGSAPNDSTASPTRSRRTCRRPRTSTTVRRTLREAGRAVARD